MEKFREALPASGIQGYVVYPEKALSGASGHSKRPASTSLQKAFRQLMLCGQQMSVKRYLGPSCYIRCHKSNWSHQEQSPVLFAMLA